MNRLLVVMALLSFSLPAFCSLHPAVSPSSRGF